MGYTEEHIIFIFVCILRDSLNFPRETALKNRWAKFKLSLNTNDCIYLIKNDYSTYYR